MRGRKSGVAGWLCASSGAAGAWRSQRGPEARLMGGRAGAADGQCGLPAPMGEGELVARIDGRRLVPRRGGELPARSGENGLAMQRGARCGRNGIPGERKWGKKWVPSKSNPNKHPLGG